MWKFSSYCLEGQQGCQSYIHTGYSIWKYFGAETAEGWDKVDRWVLPLYNLYMGGVDLGDQLWGYYHVRLKCTKNYKYIFWFLVDVSPTNAFILHSFDVQTGTPMTLKQFRLKLAEQLIGTYISRKRIGRARKRPCPTSTSTSNPTAHPPTPVAVCVVFIAGRYAPLHVGNTVWVCAERDSTPPLCLTGRSDGSDCFRLWHQQWTLTLHSYLYYVHNVQNPPFLFASTVNMQVVSVCLQQY